MILLTNALSINMLSHSIVPDQWTLHVDRITSQEAAAILSGGYESRFGHKDTAGHLGRYLHIGFVPANRTEYQLRPGDIVIIAQVTNIARYLDKTDPLPHWKFFRAEFEPAKKEAANDPE